MARPFRMNRGEYEKLGRMVREQILTAYHHDSCIATARATLDVLRKVGVDAYVLPVQAVAFNRPVWEWAVAHGRFPLVGSEDYPEDGYGIGVGVGPENTEDGVGWNGHLVVIAERRWLLDFSIDQMSRPQFGLTISEPVIIEVGEKFLRSRGDVAAVTWTGESVIQYATAPEKQDYKNSPNWNGESRPEIKLTRVNRK